MKKTPGTSLSVLAVWGVLLYGIFVTLPKLAQAADVIAAQADARAMKDAAVTIQASVASLDRRIRYDGLKRELEQVESDIAAVDREVTRVMRSGVEPSDYLLNRQQQLTTRRSELNRQINAMIQQYPGLVSE